MFTHIQCDIKTEKKLLIKCPKFVTTTTERTTIFSRVSNFSNSANTSATTRPTTDKQNWFYYLILIFLNIISFIVIICIAIYCYFKNRKPGIH